MSLVLLIIGNIYTLWLHLSFHRWITRVFDCALLIPSPVLFLLYHFRLKGSLPTVLSFPFYFSPVEFLSLPIRFISLSPTVSSMIFGLPSKFTVHISLMPSLNFINVLLSSLWQPLLETWDSICSHSGPWGSPAPREPLSSSSVFCITNLCLLPSYPSPWTLPLDCTHYFSCGTILKYLNRKGVIFYNSIVKQIRAQVVGWHDTV